MMRAIALAGYAGNRAVDAAAKTVSKQSNCRVNSQASGHPNAIAKRSPVVATARPSAVAIRVTAATKTVLCGSTCAALVSVLTSALNHHWVPLGAALLGDVSPALTVAKLSAFATADGAAIPFSSVIAAMIASEWSRLFTGWSRYTRGPLRSCGALLLKIDSYSGFIS
jgi:hypothetical protein